MKDRITVSATPTLDTSAYATADRMGSLMTFSNAGKEDGGAVTLKGVTVLDKGKQSAAMDLLLFDEAPTIASADNAAADISDAEMAKCIGAVSIVAGDYVILNANSVATKECLRQMRCKAQSRNLYGLLVSRGSPTYAASDLRVSLQIEQD